MERMNADIIFTLANMVFAVGTLFLLYKVIKQRNMLNDFDLIGSLLTTTALILMLAGYKMLDMLGSIVFMIPTLAFWITVSIYTVQNKLQGKTG